MNHIQAPFSLRAPLVGRVPLVGLGTLPIAGRSPRSVPQVVAAPSESARFQIALAPDGTVGMAVDGSPALPWFLAGLGTASFLFILWQRFGSPARATTRGNRGR
jgi:hypothetical protein